MASAKKARVPCLSMVISSTLILRGPKCEVVSSTSVSFFVRSCWPAVLLYVQSDVVLALSVDLPTVQMDWLVFSMNWALVSQFLLLSCLHWHWGVRRNSWTWWESYLVFWDDLAVDRDKKRKSKYKVTCVGVSSFEKFRDQHRSSQKKMRKRKQCSGFKLQYWSFNLRKTVAKRVLRLFTL